MPAAAPPQSSARIASNTPRQSRGIGRTGRRRRGGDAAVGDGRLGRRLGRNDRLGRGRSGRAGPAARRPGAALVASRINRIALLISPLRSSTVKDPSTRAPCPTGAGAASAGGRWRRCARPRCGGPCRARWPAAGRSGRAPGRRRTAAGARAWRGGYGRARCSAQRSSSPSSSRAPGAWKQASVAR